MAARILVVEDHDDTREMIVRMLELHGYAPFPAENGCVGLEVGRACCPAVILLDLMMPELDGYGFRREQLDDPVLARVPVLCISAFGDCAALSAQLGVPCLPKPIDWDDVLTRVAQLCGDHGHGSPPTAGRQQPHFPPSPPP